VHGERVKGLLTIGEFAEASRISPKALRLYAEQGLLKPTRVDGESGYRYYRAEQLPAARLIALLRAADMPLREIRRFLVDPRPELLDDYRTRLQAEHEARLDVLRYVRRVLEEAEMFEVQTKHVPAQRYVSKTANVTVEELAPFIGASIGELAAGGIEGAPFAVFHGLVNETDDGPVEVGVPRGSGDRELPAAEVAFVVTAGESAKFPEILGAYDALTRWAREHGRDFAAPPREVYLSRPDEPAHWEVAWPLG
jgi:DNA-binding transcriptional MerR regulator